MAAETRSAPVVIIQPSRGWVPIKLRELWAHRELLYFLVWRDLKVRYRQTVLGVVWVVIQPLFMMLVFTFLFQTVAPIDTDPLHARVVRHRGGPLSDGDRILAVCEDDMRLAPGGI